MIKFNSYVTLLMFLISFSTYGQMDQFNYSRALTGIEEQWHSVELPSYIFQHLNASMSDIRIYGITETNDTIEAPYLLEVKKEQNTTKKIAFNVLNKSANTQGYYFTFEVPKSESINRVNLNFRQTNFDWKIKFEGSQDQNEWYTIIDNYRILSIRNNATEYQFTRLNIPNSNFKYYRLLIPSKEKPDLLSAEIELNETIDGKYYDHEKLVIKNKQNKTSKNSVFNVKFNNPVFVNQITIPVTDKFDYYRTFSIKQITDSIKTEKGWKYNYKNLSTGVISSIEDHVYKFNGRVMDQLQITIFNQDNQPLTIGQIQAKGYVHELQVRFTKPATYFMTYGNVSIHKPNYDLAQFKSDIPTKLNHLSLGSEVKNNLKAKPKVEPLFKNKTWLWVIMGSIILLLGWFTLSMISKK